EPKDATKSASLAPLKDLERRVQETAKKVRLAVVAVEHSSKPAGPEPKRHEWYASGVIISADGLVLSQHHVSHLLGSTLDPDKKTGERGERVTVILHDGRRCKAELLGADEGFDISLLRLIEAGPWPHTPFDEEVTVKLGDGVLTVGHPRGYRPDRGAVVRFAPALGPPAGCVATDSGTPGRGSGGP